MREATYPHATESGSIGKRVASGALGACAYGVSLGGLLAPGLTGRLLFAQAVKLAGTGILKLAPSIYGSLDEGNKQFATGERTRRPILERRRFAEVLQKTETGELSIEEAVRQLDIPDEYRADAMALNPGEVFAGVDPAMEVAVQFSGGGDSTLAGLLAAQYFRRVHLLTGFHTFISGRDKARVNARKLINIFDSEKVRHVFVNTTRPLRQILFGEWWADLREYGIFPITGCCLACKLSYDIGMLSYARENNVGAVLDGSDMMIQFQLSQGNPELMQRRNAFYEEHGVRFLHPCANVRDGAMTLFALGRQMQPPVTMYPSQPGCRGLDFLGQISKRFYFLPKHGMDGLTDMGLRYAESKLSLCEEMLSSDCQDCVRLEPGANSR